MTRSAGFSADSGMRGDFTACGCSAEIMKYEV
jgi:hypothetical protein